MSVQSVPEVSRVGVVSDVVVVVGPFSLVEVGLLPLSLVEVGLLLWVSDCFLWGACPPVEGHYGQSRLTVARQDTYKPVTKYVKDFPARV